jgi:hypothetical protein
VQVRLALGDQFTIPARRVPFVQRQIGRVRRRGPGRHEGEQRGESPRFRLVVEQGRRRDGEVPRFVGGRLDGGPPRPRQGVAAVDRLQHRWQALGHDRSARHDERDPGVADPPLGAHQALLHRPGRHRERPGDVGGIEAQHGLQHQRRPNVRGDRRVGAHEEQRQPPLRDVVGVEAVEAVEIVEGVGRGVGGRLQRHVPAVRGRLPLVPLAVAGDRQQPAFRVVRYAVARPRDQRLLERLGQRFLSQLEVAGGGGQQRDQPAVRRPRGALHHAGRAVTGHDDGTQAPASMWTAPGRTSTVPHEAGGACRAHSSALSRSGTSMMTIPPNCSLVSANGPSWIRGSPSAMVMVVEALEGWST